MHLKLTAALALLSYLALPHLTQARALTIPDFCQHESFHRARHESDVQNFRADSNQSRKRLDIDVLNSSGADAFRYVSHFLTSRAFIKGPKKADPKDSDPVDENGGNGGAIDPFNPHKEPEHRDDGTGGAIDPFAPKPDPPETPNEPDEEPDGAIDSSAPSQKGDEAGDVNAGNATVSDAPAGNATAETSDAERAELCARWGARLLVRGL